MANSMKQTSPDQILDTKLDHGFGEFDTDSYGKNV